MAGDWIKMRMALHTDLRVTKLARIINGGPFLGQLAPEGQLSDGSCDVHALQHLVVGALHHFWCAAQEISEDGFLDGLTPSDIDCMVGIFGFGDALIDVGWLEYRKQEDDLGCYLTLPHFTRHNGDSAKSRAMGAERTAKHREKEKALAEIGNGEASPEKRREEKRVGSSYEEPPTTPPSAGGGEERKVGRPKAEQHPRAEGIAKMIGKGVKHWKPDAKAKTDSASSIRSVDLMLRVDHRDPDEAVAVLGWLFGCEDGDYESSNGFDWRPNVASGGALRKQWDRLVTLMNSQAEGLAAQNGNR